MITDVLYHVNMYICLRVKRFELSHVMDIALYKRYVLLLLLLTIHNTHYQSTTTLTLHVQRERFGGLTVGCVGGEADVTPRPRPISHGKVQS